MASGAKSPKKDSIRLVVKVLAQSQEEYSTLFGERRLQSISVIQ